MKNTYPFNLSDIAKEQVRVYYLEMRSRPQPTSTTGKVFDFKKLQVPIEVNQYRQLYYGVGKQWNWLDRMVMPDQELENLINANSTEVYSVSIEGITAGFAEFMQTNNFVEIVYFGLFPEFIGKGVGKQFLQAVVEKAWAYDPTWIQLNTCELDHPNALPVYLKVGFSLVREENEERRVLKA